MKHWLLRLDSLFHCSLSITMITHDVCRVLIFNRNMARFHLPALVEVSLTRDLLPCWSNTYYFGCPPLPEAVRDTQSYWSIWNLVWNYVSGIFESGEVCCIFSWLQISHLQSLFNKRMLTGFDVKTEDADRESIMLWSLDLKSWSSTRTMSRLRIVSVHSLVCSGVWGAQGGDTQQG